MTPARFCVVLCLLFSWDALAQSSGAPILSVPPAALRPEKIEKAATPAPILESAAPVFRIDLATPAASELATMKSLNSAAARHGQRMRTKALAVGFGREVPTTARTILLSTLTWVGTSDGGRVARIEIHSPNATALRVAMQLPPTDPDLTVQFAGQGVDAKAFGAVPAKTIAQDTARYGKYWSPVLEGEIATIEFHAGPGAVLNDLVLTLPRVAHQVANNSELRTLSTKTVDEIGAAQSCNIDVACVAPTTALTNAAKAVAQLLFIGDDEGNQYLCTGTLLNDMTSSNTPYLFTAAHCMINANAAHTLNTFWFFDANRMQEPQGSALRPVDRWCHAARPRPGP